MKIDVHLHPEELARALREDVERGLTSTPKQLPPKWFYDERGCRLFDEITRLPEYYPTRREREILAARCSEIAALTDADTLVELGSGTSEKTRTLLAALRDHGTLRRFVPFDVSEPTLREVSDALEHEFPGLDVHAVVGDFDRHLDTIPNEGRRLIAFLGGTIGNFGPEDRQWFLKEVVTSMNDGDHLLVGFDLVKDIDRLEAAYNDNRGVTAEFNRNVLRVINEALDADVDVDAFEHMAFFDIEEEWIEMRLRSLRAQTARIADLGLVVSWDEGEQMRTEISCKFTHQGAERELTDAGLDVLEWWTDSAGDFALALSVACG